MVPQKIKKKTKQKNLSILVLVAFHTLLQTCVQPIFQKYDRVSINRFITTYKFCLKASDKQKPMNFLESISLRLSNARISERKINSRQKYLTIDINKIASEISLV